jgi:hypothetical protein
MFSIFLHTNYYLQLNELNLDAITSLK